MVIERVILGILFLSGCTAETSSTGRDVPPDSAKETTSPKIPAVPAPSQPEPAREAPLLSWSFEPASADCNGWPTFGADAIRASPARTGAYSCKVCSNGSAANLGIVRDLGVVPAGRYVLTAWVRKRFLTAAPAEALVRIEAETSSGSVAATAPSVVVRAEWARLEATLDLDKGASNLRVSIGAPSDEEADRCMFVDDVMLTRE